MKLPAISAINITLLAPYLLLLGVCTLIVWGIYTREADREYPADYETIEAQIQQALKKQALLEQAPPLKQMTTHWQLAVKLAASLNLEFAYAEPREKVRYVYSGPAVRWDGLVSGPASTVIAFLETIQHEVPVFLNQIEAKNGTMSVLISIIGVGP